MPMARLARELSLSDRQVGMGLARLIRRGAARIRMGPDGLRVARVETVSRQV